MIYSVIEHNLLNLAAKVEVIKTSQKSHLRCLQLIKALKVYGDWLWACKNREPVDINPALAPWGQYDPRLIG